MSDTCASAGSTHAPPPPPPSLPALPRPPLPAPPAPAPPVPPCAEPAQCHSTSAATERVVACGAASSDSTSDTAAHGGGGGGSAASSAPIASDASSRIVTALPSPCEPTTKLRRRVAAPVPASAPGGAAAALPPSAALIFFRPPPPPPPPLLSAAGCAAVSRAAVAASMSSTAPLSTSSRGTRSIDGSSAAPVGVDASAISTRSLGADATHASAGPPALPASSKRHTRIDAACSLGSASSSRCAGSSAGSHAAPPPPPMLPAGAAAAADVDDSSRSRHCSVDSRTALRLWRRNGHRRGTSAAAVVRFGLPMLCLDGGANLRLHHARLQLHGAFHPSDRHARLLFNRRRAGLLLDHARSVLGNAPSLRINLSSRRDPARSERRGVEAREQRHDAHCRGAELLEHAQQPPQQAAHAPRRHAAVTQREQRARQSAQRVSARGAHVVVVSRQSGWQQHAAEVQPPRQQVLEAQVPAAPHVPDRAFNQLLQQPQHALYRAQAERAQRHAERLRRRLAHRRRDLVAAVVAKPVERQHAHQQDHAVLKPCRVSGRRVGRSAVRHRAQRPCTRAARRRPARRRVRERRHHARTRRVASQHLTQRDRRPVPHLPYRVEHVYAHLIGQTLERPAAVRHVPPLVVVALSRRRVLVARRGAAARLPRVATAAAATAARRNTREPAAAGVARAA
eukprot:366113-Chlamydomonas_euryale.AAC.3